MDRMFPAQETFEPVDFAGLNVDLRLVVGFELAEFNGLSEIYASNERSCMSSSSQGR